MDSITIRSFAKLTYQDPEPFLVRLRELEYELANLDISTKIKNLRTNLLKESRELRQAALFCHFMSERIGTKVYLSKVESQDYDFVAWWVNNDNDCYAPVQIKEVVPEATNQNANIADIIKKLDRYVDSNNLIVVIHINRECHFIPAELETSKLTINQLWIFGAITANQNNWGLWGDFCKIPAMTTHNYPLTV